MENSKKTEETKTVKLSYEASTIGKTLSSGLFDFFVMAVVGFLLLFATLSIIQSNSSYKEIISSRNDILVSSELYYETDDAPTKINESLDDNTEMTYNEKSTEIDNRLVYFFQTFLDGNPDTNDSIKGKGYATYLALKADAKTSDDETMFSSDYQRILTNADYDDDYYTFYSDAVDTATGYLQANPTYYKTRNQINKINLWGIILTFAFSYIIFYFIIPLCCSRGKRTLGMSITKLALVSSNGLSCTWERYIFHFLFNFAFLFFGSIFAFLIPLAISITMIIVRKDHRCLTDYVVGTYLVSSDQAIVYKDAIEYEGMKRKEERLLSTDDIKPDNDIGK